MALRGDHFIIRDETARRTLGGGLVIHPWPRTHGRREPGLADTLKTLQGEGLADAVEIFLAESDDFAVPIGPLYQFLNVRAEEAGELLQRMKAIRVVSLESEHVYTTEQKWKTLQAEVLAALGDFHTGHPLAPGKDMEELRDQLRRRIPARLFRAFVEQLELDKAVVRDGSLLRLPDYTITLRDDEQRLVEQIKVLLGASPLAPPDLTQLEQAVGVGRGRLTEMLRILEREGSVVRVTADLYFLNESIERVKRTLHEEFSKGDLTPAMFRDRFGTSRKYAIPLLEYLDREGVTVRMGDARRLKAGSRMRHGESHTA